MIETSEIKSKLVDNIKVRLTLVKPNGEIMARSIPWQMIENEIRACHLRKIPAEVEHNSICLGYSVKDTKGRWLWWVESNELIREKINLTIV